MVEILSVRGTCEMQSLIAPPDVDTDSSSDEEEEEAAAAYNADACSDVETISSGTEICVEDEWAALELEPD